MTANIAKLYSKHVVLLKPLLNEIKKQIKKGNLVLDLGCGSGANIKALEKQVGKNGEIVCIDNNKEMILHCRKKFSRPNILIKKLSAEKISSLGKKFDVIFASLVLQFTKAERAISEIKKSLKPNGKLIFSIPLYRTGINIGLGEESEKFKFELEKNLKDELKKSCVKDNPSLEYTNTRDRLFKRLLQKNQFRISKWSILPLEKNNLKELLDYYKIPWRSAKILNKPFTFRYKVISNALKKTFKKYPNYIVKRYYLVGVADNKIKVIKSKKFILRPYRKGDEMSLIRNINDKDIYKYTLRIPHPYRLKDAKDWISNCLNSEKNKDKTSVNFAIDINGEVVGGIGFDPIEGRKAEIGYWLGKKYWNKGIITEAVKLVTRFGFQKLKLKGITAHLFSGNKASARVLEKNGYKLKGLLRKHHLKDGKYLDALLYAKVK